jgi:hypothetical protein
MGTGRSYTATTFFLAVALTLAAPGDAQDLSKQALPNRRDR